MKVERVRQEAQGWYGSGCGKNKEEGNSGLGLKRGL